MITRRFEYTGDGSNKFWTVEYPDAYQDRGVRTWTTRWGRIGTAGQSKTFTERDQIAAIAAAADKIREKTRKGYVEMVNEVRRPHILIQPTIVAYENPRRRAKAAKPPAQKPAATLPSYGRKLTRKITLE